MTTETPTPHVEMSADGTVTMRLSMEHYDLLWLALSMLACYKALPHSAGALRVFNTLPPPRRTY